MWGLNTPYPASGGTSRTKIIEYTLSQTYRCRILKRFVLPLLQNPSSFWLAFSEYLPSKRIWYDWSFNLISSLYTTPNLLTLAKPIFLPINGNWRLWNFEPGNCFQIERLKGCEMRLEVINHYQMRPGQMICHFVLDPHTHKVGQ